MSVAFAEVITLILGLYFALGALFALVFVTIGVSKIDPATKGMPIRARALIFPGVVGLWPLMLAKLFTQKAPPIS